MKIKLSIIIIFFINILTYGGPFKLKEGRGFASDNGNYIIKVDKEPADEKSPYCQHLWKLYKVNGNNYELYSSFIRAYPHQQVFISDEYNLIIILESNPDFITILNKEGKEIKTLTDDDFYSLNYTSKYGYKKGPISYINNCYFDEKTFFIIPRFSEDNYTHQTEIFKIDCESLNLSREKFNYMIKGPTSLQSKHQNIIIILSICLTLTTIYIIKKSITRNWS